MNMVHKEGGCTRVHPYFLVANKHIDTMNL